MPKWEPMLIEDFVRKYVMNHILGKVASLVFRAAKSNKVEGDLHLSPIVQRPWKKKRKDSEHDDSLNPSDYLSSDKPSHYALFFEQKIWAH